MQVYIASLAGDADIEEGVKEGGLSSHSCCLSWLPGMGGHKVAALRRLPLLGVPPGSLGRGRPRGQPPLFAAVAGVRPPSRW